MVVLRKESAYCLKTRGGRGRYRTSSLLASLNSKTLSEEGITDRVQSLRKQLVDHGGLRYKRVEIRFGALSSGRPAHNPRERKGLTSMTELRRFARIS